MSKVLVFCEYDGDNLKKGAQELLTAAKASGKTVAAFAFGSGAKEVANSAASYGATEFYTCSDASLNNYNPEAYSSATTDIIKSSSATEILASASMLAKDLFPRVASTLGAGFASDCTTLELANELSATKPMYAAKCTAKVNFKNCDIKIVLMRANQLPVGEPDSAASVDATEVPLSPVDLKTLVKEVVKGTSQKLDLTEANIVVSGGRGMKGPEHFKLLEDLADTLGATVGASRAVVDAGWVPHTMQVGQTGKTVAPTLYIACGISGAIQHLAGMSGSKVVVAINTDAEAPIFQKATYGIVGDAFEVLPALTQEFKALLQ